MKRTRLSYPSMSGQKRSKSPRTEDETRDHLAEIWGDQADEKFEKVEKLLKEFGTEELFSYLDYSKFGNYSSLIERIYQIAENREKVLKSEGDNPFGYNSMANATVKSLNLQTRQDLNRAFSDAHNDYVAEFGDDINTALPQDDLFRR